MANFRIYRGWWIVSAIFLASAFTVGSDRYAFGLFVEPLEETFGWSRTQISASLSFAAVSGLMAPLFGWIMDRYGAKWIMTTSLLLIGLSYLLRPLMSELWHLYALSLLQYIGYTSATILPTGRLVGIWFRNRRGRVMGLTSMGNNFGGLVFPLIAGSVLSAASWQWGYIVFAGIAFLVMVYALVVVREPPPSGNIEPQRRQTLSILTGWTVKQALRSKAFYAITLAILLGNFTYSTVLPHVVTHLINEGISVTMASLALSILAAFGMLGKLVMGYLSERITARYALMIDLCGQAFFLILMLFAGSSAMILWFSVILFGFFFGAFGALLQLIVYDTFGIRFYGSIMGIISLTTIVSFSVGPILAGASFDITSSYRIAFIIAAALFLTGALSLTQARATQPQASVSVG